MKVFNVRYRFRFNDGREKVFVENFRADTLEPIGKPSRPPAWTALEYHRCSNCPLNPAQQAYCPAALSLVKLIEECAELDPLEAVILEVTTAERVVTLSTTVQNGVGSLMGLVIAASGCPHSSFFRPIARYHVPLASEEETIFRVVSMYFLGQYVRQQAKLGGELTLDGLFEVYRQLETVNNGIAQRLRAAGEAEISVKTLMGWDVFSGMFPMRTSEILERMKLLFAAYLKSS
ncbi:MAG: hypothetical protein HY272_03065 [Gammaproteobacteria bacterium]|nr:hypothetical protein [Gammaproteobacteria bacterium]